MTVSQPFTLVGFTGSNPEVRITQNGALMTSLSFATSRFWKNADGTPNPNERVG